MPNDQQMPRTVEEWIASYHTPNGVITRFVTEQVNEKTGEPVSDEDKQIVTELIERVLPHFDMWIAEASSAERSATSCSAAADLVCGIMLSRIIRLTIDNPLKYGAMASRHCQGIKEALRSMILVATNDDMHALIGDINTDDGQKRFKELVIGMIN
jgi:hypothetical protein